MSFEPLSGSAPLHFSGFRSPLLTACPSDCLDSTTMRLEEQKAHHEMEGFLTTLLGMGRHTTMG